MPINECRLINFKRFDDKRGSLIPIEGNLDIPFAIKRVYYLFDVPKDTGRGCHAHMTLEQILIPINGSFDVLINDGKKSETWHLDSPHIGLYIPSMVWRELNNFSSGSTCFVLASDLYNENDYCRHYPDYLKMTGTLA